MSKPTMKAVDESMLRFLNHDITELQQLALKYSNAGEEDKVHEILIRLRDTIDALVRRPNSYNS